MRTFNIIVQNHTETLFNSLKENTFKEDIENVINQNATIEEKLKENLLKLTQITINRLKNNFNNTYRKSGYVLAEAINEPFKNIISIYDSFKDPKSNDIAGSAVSIGMNSTNYLHTLLGGMIYEQMFNNIPKLTKEEFINFVNNKIDKTNPHFKELNNIKDDNTQGIFLIQPGDFFSIGAYHEMVYCHNLGKPVYSLILNGHHEHPWVKFHSTKIFTTCDEINDFLLNNFELKDGFIKEEILELLSSASILFSK